MERAGGKDPPFPTKEAATAYALDQYRFYECSKCHKPYFGGNRNCGPDAVQPQEEAGWVEWGGREYLGFFRVSRVSGF